MPAGDFKLYWSIALEKLKSKEGKQQKQAEVFEDEITDGNII